jgi:hypothetical protein
MRLVGVWHAFDQLHAGGGGCAVTHTYTCNLYVCLKGCYATTPEDGMQHFCPGSKAAKYETCWVREPGCSRLLANLCHPRRPKTWFMWHDCTNLSHCCSECLPSDPRRHPLSPQHATTPCSPLTLFACVPSTHPTTHATSPSMASTTRPRVSGFGARDVSGSAHSHCQLTRLLLTSTTAQSQRPQLHRCQP